MQRLSSLLIATIAATFCATPADAQSVQIREKSLSKTTPDSLGVDYAIERVGKPIPKVGLSLAGGGTRAGYFAHGVLQGLNDTGLLKKVDVISTVSGGSYAAYWYFTKRLEVLRENLPEDAMFADCLPKWWVKVGGSTDYEIKLEKLMNLAEVNGSPKMPTCPTEVHWVPGDPYRWQAHLARWPDVFRHRPGVVNGNKQRAPYITAGSYIPGILAEFVTGYIKGRSILPNAYHYGIERTWGLSPREREFATASPTWKDDKANTWQYSNKHGTQWKRNMRVDPKKDNWDELKAATQRVPNFPLWILNSTQGQKHAKRPEPDHIYEMTAFAHGSRGLGYINESPLVMGVDALGKATLASAAFADDQGVTNKFARALMKLHKGAEWGIDVDNRFVPGKKLHLSDGGGSENLGLYSLIKRGIPDIIVVDDAQDIAGRMDDLCWVRQALKQEHEDFKMEFKALKDFDLVCESQFAGGEKSTVLGYNTSAWFNPVVEGSITWPTGPDGKSMPKTRLWLVKLGWNQQDFRRAFNAGDCGSESHPVNCLLTVYYGHNTLTVNNMDNYMVFPYLSTVGATFNSSTYLFWAYRELGRMVMAKLAWTDENGGQLKLDPAVKQCEQYALKVRKGRRPVDRPESVSAAKRCQ